MNTLSILMEMQAQQRAQFVQSHEMINSELVLDYFGKSKAHIDSEIASLVHACKILVIEHNDQKLIPKFQFDDNGRVYQTIELLLEHAGQCGVSSLELALWLTEERTEIKEQKQQSVNLKGINANDLSMLLTQIDKDTTKYTGRPIDWIVRCDIEPLNIALSTFIPSFTLMEH